jgi:hypothetical protein
LLVKCPVFKIPSSIVIRIGTLGLGEAIRIEDLVLDPDIEPQARPDEVIVQVVEPRKAAEPEGEEAEAVDATGDEGDKKEASGEE